MTTIIGTVDRIDSRPVNTKFGLKNAYDLTVDGTRYGAGFKDPSTMGVSVGTIVEFDAVAKGSYNNVTSNTLRVLPPGSTIPSGQQPPPATMAQVQRAAAGFPVKTDSDKFAIIRQNALTNAVNLLGSIRGDAFPKTVDDTVDLVIAIAYKFTDFSSGQREVKAARRMRDLGEPVKSTEDMDKLVSNAIDAE